MFARRALDRCAAAARPYQPHVPHRPELQLQSQRRHFSKVPALLAKHTPEDQFHNFVPTANAQGFMTRTLDPISEAAVRHAVAQNIAKAQRGARLGNVVFEQMTAEHWFKYFDADDSGDVTLEEFLYGVTCVPELRIVGMVLNWKSVFEK